MFSKVLVANRGEIAIRVMRALEELGIASVAVYSEADRDAPHVRRADEAYLLGPGPAAESYLVVEKILEVAKQSGAEAIHPGYGFLAENAPFARACDEAGIVFIGPPADAIDSMGSKTKARELMQAAGVPIVPGTTDPVETVEDARKIIDDSIGYPVAVKAAGGGGGKGFRVALTEDELQDAFEGAAREGEKFFSDATVYIERYLPDPRHVEVQVLADSHGNVVHLFERDCSVQRRHQKVTGVDIVREQILVAGGAELSFKQEDLEIRGHAIECRINAEDASKNFAPAPGQIGNYVEPSGPFVRVDSGAESGYAVLPLYDPMIAKLIVWDVDRESATRRMLRALSEYELEGIKTLIPFHEALLKTDEWAAGETCRNLMEDKKWLKATAPEQPVAPVDGDEDEKVERDYAVEVSGRKFDVKVIGSAFGGGGGSANGAGPARQAPKRSERKKSASGGPDQIESPLQGNMWKVVVKQGDVVEEGQLLCIIEAMKMENEITAHKAGTIATLSIEEGKPISAGDPIATITSPPAEG